MSRQMASEKDDERIIRSEKRISCLSCLNTFIFFANGFNLRLINFHEISKTSTEHVKMRVARTGVGCDRCWWRPSSASPELNLKTRNELASRKRLFDYLLLSVYNFSAQFLEYFIVNFAESFGKKKAGASATKQTFFNYWEVPARSLPSNFILISHFSQFYSAKFYASQYFKSQVGNVKSQSGILIFPTCWRKLPADIIRRCVQKRA